MIENNYKTALQKMLCGYVGETVFLENRLFKLLSIKFQVNKSK